MARTPDVYDKRGQPVNPERRSSGSQFYLILNDAPHLDGKYTIFGKVVGGMDVLTSLRKGDKIKKLTVFIREGGR
jgi:cyclophilin family peptidyl-prolyl cis-trans isomerase